MAGSDSQGDFMNRTRVLVLAALVTVLLALLASTALAGAKDPEKGGGWDPVPVDLAPLEP
jgi:hypothetical protein